MPLSQPVQRLLQIAGNTTYSCYLLQFPIQLSIAIGFSLLRLPIPFHDQLFWAAFVSGTLIAAHLVYRYFEAPAQKLIRSRLLRREGVSNESLERRRGLSGEMLPNARRART
jgi:peptidoglycan/LPS O-acetylase OafA/YrhL